MPELVAGGVGIPVFEPPAQASTLVAGLDLGAVRIGQPFEFGLGDISIIEDGPPAAGE
jgi:hypothetical protein